MRSQNSSRSLMMPTPVRVTIALKKDVTPFWSTPDTRVNILRLLASMVASIGSLTWVDLPAHVPHHQDYWERGCRLPAFGHTEGVAGLHLVLEKCFVVFCDYANGFCITC